MVGFISLNFFVEFFKIVFNLFLINHGFISSSLGSLFYVIDALFISDSGFKVQNGPT